MKNADVILLLQKKLPKGHLVDWYETMSMILETLPGEPEFDIVDEEFVVTTGNFAASFKAVSDGIEIQTLTSFGDKPSGYRITVPNDLKLVKALEALYNKAHAPEYKPGEVSSLDRYYFASGDDTMRRRQADQSGYILEMYYDIVTTESAEDGDVAERGYVVDGQRYPIEDPTQGIPEEDKEYHEAKYDTLEEVVDDISNYSWIEWSGSPASPGDWLVTESVVEDYSTDEHISYSAFITHSDGSEMSPEEMQYVHDRLGLHGKIQTTASARTAAPTQPPETLAQALQGLIDQARAEWDEVMEGLSNQQDEYADVHILVGDEAQRYSEGASVVMTYDGAGYDMLSYVGEMEHMGGSDLRVKVKNTAAELGYKAEDANNWSMSFYPDESAEVYHPPKRETPQWLRDELEDEFGSQGRGASMKKLFDTDALRLGSVLKQRFADRFSTEPRDFEVLEDTH